MPVDWEDMMEEHVQLCREVTIFFNLKIIAIFVVCVRKHGRATSMTLKTLIKIVKIKKSANQT